MSTQTSQELNVLDDVQNLIVLRYSGKDRHVYAVKPSVDVMRQFYEQSISSPADANVPAFSGYWDFNEQTGIRGSSTFLTLRLDKIALRPSGL